MTKNHRESFLTKPEDYAIDGKAVGVKHTTNLTDFNLGNIFEQVKKNLTAGDCLHDIVSSTQKHIHVHDDPGWLDYKIFALIAYDHTQVGMSLKTLQSWGLSKSNHETTGKIDAKISLHVFLHTSNCEKKSQIKNW